MFTTIAWSAAVDQVALAAIAAVPDPHVRVNVNDIIVPSALPNLVGAYVASEPGATPELDVKALSAIAKGRERTG